MNDLLPVEQKDFKLTAAFWQAFEDTVGRWTRAYGYQQIRTPIVEQTGLFVRSIGEETDVVGKEMYTFSDSNDSLSLSLRPEVRLLVCVRWSNTTFCTTARKSCGIWGQCSAASVRKKAVIVSSIRSVS